MIKAFKNEQKEETICVICPTCNKPLKQFRIAKNAKIIGLSTKCKYCGAILEIKAE